MSILERNDPKDATHENPFALSAKLYLYHNDVWYYYRSIGGYWVLSINGIGWHARNLVALHEKQENEMKKDYTNGEVVDAVDVPRLIKVGKEIQYRYKTDDDTRAWSDIYLVTDEEDFTLGDLINSRYEWRIKPEFTSVNITVQKPKRIETDPVTGAVGLIYEDNKVAREVAEDLKQQFGLM